MEILPKKISSVINQLFMLNYSTL